MTDATQRPQTMLEISQYQRITALETHIAALEAELTAARRCPLCGGRTQEIAVKVKPLAWDRRCGETAGLIADADVGVYRVVEPNGCGWWMWFHYTNFPGSGVILDMQGDTKEEAFATIDDAIASVNEHRASRILSTIEAAPVQSAQARPSVAEAARRLLDLLQMRPDGKPEISSDETQALWDIVQDWGGFQPVSAFLCFLTEDSDPLKQRALAGEDGQ